MGKEKTGGKKQEDRYVPWTALVLRVIRYCWDRSDWTWDWPGSLCFRHCCVRLPWTIAGRDYTTISCPVYNGKAWTNGMMMEREKTNKEENEARHWETKQLTLFPPWWWIKASIHPGSHREPIRWCAVEFLPWRVTYRKRDLPWGFRNLVGSRLKKKLASRRNRLGAAPTDWCCCYSWHATRPGPSLTSWISSNTSQPTRLLMSQLRKSTGPWPLSNCFCHSYQNAAGHRRLHWWQYCCCFCFRLTTEKYRRREKDLNRIQRLKYPLDLFFFFYS